MKKLLTVAAAIVAATFLAGPVLANKGAQHGSMSVDDKAGAFTAEGVKKAEAKFEGTEFKVSTHYTVVTMKSIPADKLADFSKVDKKDSHALQSFFATLARQLAESRGETGVFTLAYSDSTKFFVVTVTGTATDVHRNFGDSKAGVLNGKLKDAFKEALKQSGDEAQATRDRGLLSATEYLIDQLKNTTIPDGAKPAAAKKAAGGGGLSILQWVLIIGGGLLVMWLVIGLIRALTGGGGGGGGGYGGGGGGGGFGSSLLGGMFGAMAGMYLYNSMFGGGMSHAAASDGDYGGGDGGYDGGTNDGDFGGGAEAGGGGGDWGDSGGDGAGGDWGGGDAGGGDFGGGDFGGGGDW